MRKKFDENIWEGRTSSEGVSVEGSVVEEINRLVNGVDVMGVREGRVIV